MSAAESSFTPIQAASLVEAARAQIREGILAGELRPGEPLRDSVLATGMGISRSPVREALRLLEQSGLVQKSNNRSYRVSALVPDDIPELAALRAADEVLAVRFIVKNRVPLTELDDVIDRLRAAGDEVPAIAAVDADFHATVVRLAGLPRLYARYSEITDQIRLALIAGNLEAMNHGVRERAGSAQMVRNHVELRDALSEAIASRSTAGLTELWEDHVLAGLSARGLFELR